MATIIQWNGSHFAGDGPDGIERLFEMLAAHPLDRTFEPERYGNFVYRLDDDPKFIEQYPEANGMTRFFGNFFTYSHAFCVDSDDVDFIARMTAAIRVNQQRPDYLAQQDEAARTAERKRQLQRELNALG